MVSWNNGGRGAKGKAERCVDSLHLLNRFNERRYDISEGNEENCSLDDTWNRQGKGGLYVQGMEISINLNES